jgi:hypothetical protein
MAAHVLLALAALILLGVSAMVANLATSILADIGLASAAVVGIFAWRRTTERARREELKAPSTAVLVVHGTAAALTILLAIAAASRLQ